MNIIVEGKPVGRKKRLEKVGWRRNNGGSENKAVIDETEKQDLPYPVADHFPLPFPVVHEINFS